MQRILRVGALGAIAIALWGAAATAQPFVYVAELGSDDVLVIDAATLGPVASLPFGEDPDGLAVSPDGRRVYVAGFLSNTVGEIDAETHQLLATVPVGEGPVGLAVTPDGARVYVTQRGADSVAAIGVASGTVEAVIPVGRGPNAIAITPDGTTAFVTNSFAPLAGEVSVLDLATDQVRNTITVGRKPSRVAITPDGRTAYVTNFRSWTSTAIDVASETVRTTFRAGLKSSAVAVNPNGAWAYIIDQRGGLSIIDVSVDQVTRSIELGGGIGGIAILRNGGTAYVARSALQVVDLGEEEVVAEVAVGDRPFAVAANCVGDGCTETPYTPKPTKTATETPTPTPTPTETLTPTATASATTTRTLGSGQRPVDFKLTFSPVASGGSTIMGGEIDPGGQAVYGIRETILLPGGVGLFDFGELDCFVESGLAVTRADFAAVAPEECGFACQALSVAIDFAEPVEAPALVYSCVLDVDPFAPIGTLRLRHLENTALDADGGALPSRGRDGILVIAPPVSPSPDLTPRPTRPPTQPPQPVIFIGRGPITARPGESATLTIRLRPMAGRSSARRTTSSCRRASLCAARRSIDPTASSIRHRQAATAFRSSRRAARPASTARHPRARASFARSRRTSPTGALYTCPQIGSASPRRIPFGHQCRRVRGRRRGDRDRRGAGRPHRVGRRRRPPRRRDDGARVLGRRQRRRSVHRRRRLRRRRLRAAAGRLRRRR